MIPKCYNRTNLTLRMSMSAVLEIQDLHVSVSDKPVLKGVNLTIRQGEVHALMGPNGTGKSTLAYSLLGHPGYTVTQGKIIFDGEDILGLPTDVRRSAWKIGCAGDACDIDVALGVHRHIAEQFPVRAAEIGGELQCVLRRLRGRGATGGHYGQPNRDEVKAKSHTVCFQRLLKVTRRDRNAAENCPRWCR